MLATLAAAVYCGSFLVSRPAAAPNGRAAVRVPAATVQMMAGKLVITDGTDSFYGSRAIFQFVYDFGDYDKITAFSSSSANAKKMLLSRNARYSGLLDVLEFAEGDSSKLKAAFSGADAWLTVNADESTVVEHLKAAQAAGVKRAFVHLSASEAPKVDIASIGSALKGGKLAYTVMRTGGLTKSGSGGGLLVSDVDLPTCDEVPADDVFRFITEALTLPEAEGRTFALCPTSDSSQLRAMRSAGCSRREEVLALLQGKIKEGVKVEVNKKELTPEEVQAAAKSDAEKAAEREEELKQLLAKAKQRGEETQKRLAAEEAAKEKLRAERQTYFASSGPSPDKTGAQGGGAAKDDETKDGGEGGGKANKGDNDKPKKDDDDDGLALV